MRQKKTIYWAIAFIIIGLVAAPLVIAGSKSDKDITLGVWTTEIGDNLTTSQKLDRDEGLLVIDIKEDSPADEAGLRDGDIIVKVDDKNIKKTSDLNNVLKNHKEGDSIEITYVRHNRERTTTVDLTEERSIRRKYSGRDYKRYYASNDDDDDEDEWDWDYDYDYDYNKYDAYNHGFIGVYLQNINGQLADYFGLDNSRGALISEVFEDSPAEKAGLKAGDVVIRADNEKIYEVEDLQDIVYDKKEGDKLELEIVRHGKTQNLTVEVTEENLNRNYSSSHHFSVPRIRIPNIPSVPSIPAIPRIKYYGDFDDDDWDGLDPDDIQELQEELKNLQEELHRELYELQKEMKEIQDKIDG